jgi:pimeloyl-ACP methyl ester carboxylesterase
MIEDKIKIWETEVNYKYLTNNDNLYTILILHGWWWSSDSWVEIWELLYSNWYNVFIPDLPWFWKTLLNWIYDINNYAQLIEDFVLKIWTKNLILWWHSNGWAIAIKIVNRWNIKINKLVLNNSAWIRNDNKRSLKRRILNNISELLKKLKPKTKKCWKKCKYLKKIREIFYKLIWSHDYLNSEKNPNLKQTYLNMISTDLVDDIKKINIDTLLIWWEKDKYTPLSDWKYMRRNIINSKLLVIENEKHWIHLSNPNELFRIFITNI